LKNRHDVIVVGAGPAGAVLAYELAKKGIEVLVLDREKLPRYKCCAGGVTSRAAKLLNFDMSEVVEDVIYELDFTFGLGSPYVGKHSQPLIYTVMRDAFDHFLVHRAQQLGAMLMDGEKVTQIRMGGDWVEILAGEDILRCRLLVGADGASSVVARGLGMERNMGYLVGIESEIVVPDEELAKWKSRVQVDLGCIPGGYAWVFPKHKHLSIGVGCLASKAGHLKRHHEEFLNSLSIGCYTIARSGSHLIPTCAKGRLVWQDKALLLGDAAGFADPLTGEGIYNAILSAQLAAPVIEDSLAHGKVGLQDYQQVVEKKIMSELAIAGKISKFFVRFPRLAFGLFNESGGVWRDMCGLICGESQYTDIKKRLSGFKGILGRLFGA
jgi:geranylgeranyl reductase family protein